MKLPRPRYKNPIKKPFTQDEIRLLLGAAEYTKMAVVRGKRPYRMKRPTANRDLAIMLVLLDTCIRVSECARATLGDLSIERGELVIKPYGSSTKSRPRMVFVGRVARKAVWRYVTDRDSFDDEPLFVTHDGRPMNRNTIRHMLVNAGKRAGVKNVYPHRFRHTIAIQYLRNGGDVFTLQRLLGHSTLEMVKKNLDLVKSDAKDAHRRSSPADRWML
jgi:integrase/recombinase XerD